ncbi:hypothetical protein GCM10028864_54340 [Microlunatus parietis]
MAQADVPAPKVRAAQWQEMVVDGVGRRAAAPPGPDSQAHADLTGIPVDRAGVDLADQVLFEDLATQISLAHPAMISLYGFDDDRTPWISTTHEPTSELIDDLKGLPFDTVIKFGAPAATEELTRTVSLVADELEKVDRVVESTGGVRGLPMEIVIEYELNPGTTELTTDEVNTLLNSVANQSPDGLLPVPVTLRATEINIEPEIAVHGGSDLDPTDVTIGGCTAGFGVRGGTRDGLASARHCYNWMKYYDLSGYIAYNSATAPEEMRDLQWHHTINGNTAAASFKTGVNSQGDAVLRTVTSWGNPAMNATVCHYGRGSRVTRCGTVDMTSTHYYDEDQRYEGIVRTSQYVSAPGDSGVPWFTNSAARGIHAAGNSVTGHSYFTWISSLSSILGVTVKVG